MAGALGASAAAIWLVVIGGAGALSGDVGGGPSARVESVGNREAPTQRRAIVRAALASRRGWEEREAQRLADAVLAESARHGVDPLLVLAVIRVESSLDPLAVSPKGALGLMQLMPDTAAWLARRRGASRVLGRDEVFEVRTNLALGVGYLAELRKRFDTEEAALAAYNVGPGAARRMIAENGAGWAERHAYPRKVLAEWERLRQER